MASLIENKTLLRGIIPPLIIVSMLGPWMFDVIFVPAEYPCSPPNVRLDGDFCGMPLSGIKFFTWFTSGSFQIIVQLMKGTFAGRTRDLVAGLSILPLIPFFTTLLIAWKRETLHMRMVNLVAWILAFFSTLTLFLLQLKPQGIRLWGLWLYVLVAICAVIIEMVMMKDNSIREH